jgi:hypothetical protein
MLFLPKQSSHALQTSRPGKTVQRSPPLKRRVVTTKQRKPGGLRAQASADTMTPLTPVSARPAKDAYVVAETVRLRRDLPMVDTAADVTCKLALLTATAAT